jgi:flavin-dependent dehydrogenase
VRRTPVLIVGGGPAGAAAAIRLARSGREVLLVERSAGPHDVVCGGFLGWDALASLRRLDIDPGALGARPIGRLRLVSRDGGAEVPLPHDAAGLSRRRLDQALLDAAKEAGAEIMRGHAARALDGGRIRLDDGEEIAAEILLLATGKHELRGAERNAPIAAAPAGLRRALSLRAEDAKDLAGTIELHLFDDGYAGLLMQDDGLANLCISISRARLKAASGPDGLVAELVAELPGLARRLKGAEAGAWSAVAGIPYGWRARSTLPGLFRIGDQAAVIASIAGDGIAIALASGIGAADAISEGGPAPRWQAGFAAHSRRPVQVAEMLRKSAERRWSRAAAMALLGRFPALARRAASLTRIGR